MLDSMIVVDLTQQLPGPFATALLSSLGARVLKVEPPDGDPSRVLDPAMFSRVNAGKESIRLDLKTPQGQAELHRLVATADVLVESFRPGVADRIGAGWETCRSLNPRLVHCSVTGFGPAGPYAHVPMHDLNVLAWGDPESARLSAGRIGVPWVDLGAGTTAALLIVSAWQATARGGAGRHLDLSMQDVALSWSRVKPVRAGGEPSYSVYRTADDRDVVIAILEDHFWLRLCVGLGLSDLGDDPALATYEGRRSRANEIDQRLAQAVALLSIAEVLRIAAASDLPVTPLDPADDSRAIEHLADSGFANGAFRLPIASPA